MEIASLTEKDGVFDFQPDADPPPKVLDEAMRAANAFHHSATGRRVWIRWIQHIGALHWERFQSLPGMPDLRSLPVATGIFDALQGDLGGTSFEFFLQKLENSANEILWCVTVT